VSGLIHWARPADLQEKSPQEKRFQEFSAHLRKIFQKTFSLLQKTEAYSTEKLVNNLVTKSVKNGVFSKYCDAEKQCNHKGLAF
jgi:hypothetical protein